MPADPASAGFFEGVFDRTLTNLRSAWRDIAESARGVLSGTPRPDLPGEDASRLHQQMLSSLDGRAGGVTARARAADLGRTYLSLDPAGRNGLAALLVDVLRPAASASCSCWRVSSMSTTTRSGGDARR